MRVGNVVGQKGNGLGRHVLLGLALMLLPSAPAIATSITEPNQITPQTVINFNSLAPGALGSPLVISGVTFSGSLHVIDVDVWGAATTFPTYVSDKALGIPQLPTSPPPFKITFGSPVAQVGFGLFDPNFAGNLFKAFNSGGTLLETTAPDALFPPGGSGADYLGFSRGAADIAYIEITAGVSSSVTDALWIDNLAFSTQVPEPGTLVLLSTGVLCLFGRRGRQR